MLSEPARPQLRHSERAVLSAAIDETYRAVPDRTPLLSDLVAVLARPRDERLDRVEQCGAERGELIVDPRRDDGKHRSVDEALAFELADREREHALADPVDLAAQFAEPARAVGEKADDEQRPLVGDPVEDVAELTGGIGLGTAGVPR